MPKFRKNIKNIQLFLQIHIKYFVDIKKRFDLRKSCKKLVSYNFLPVYSQAHLCEYICFKSQDESADTPAKETTDASI